MFLPFFVKARWVKEVDRPTAVLLFERLVNDPDLSVAKAAASTLVDLDYDHQKLLDLASKRFSERDLWWARKRVHAHQVRNRKNADEGAKSGPLHFSVNMDLNLFITGKKPLNIHRGDEGVLYTTISMPAATTPDSLRTLVGDILTSLGAGTKIKSDLDLPGLSYAISQVTLGGHMERPRAVNGHGHL